MSYDYDDEDEGAGRVLWGRIGVFVFAGLLLFLLGRVCAPDGVSPDEFARVSAQASELLIQRDQAVQQLAQAGSSESTGTPSEDATEDSGSGEATEETSEDDTTDASEESSDGNGGETYTVEAGDTLNEIAERFDVDADELAEANGIDDPGDLVVGQELEIPS